jgi:hypothetical protein
VSTNKSEYEFSTELIFFSLVLMPLLLIFGHISANMVIFNELTTHDTAAVLMLLFYIVLAVCLLLLRLCLPLYPLD